MTGDGTLELGDRHGGEALEGRELGSGDPEQLRSSAADVFDSPEAFGDGLRQEWHTLTGDANPRTAFSEAYAQYVSDPSAMRSSAPAQYEFLRDHVFFGHEFDERDDRDREVAEGAVALAGVEGLAPRTWEHLTDTERTEVLQEAERRLAAIEGRPAAPIVVQEMAPGLNGYFEPATGVLHINQALVSDPNDLAKTVDTVAHEGRHAYQHHVVDHPAADTDAGELAAWTVNFGNYLDAEHYGYELYRHQPVEEDAWAFGDGIRDALYGRPS